MKARAILSFALVCYLALWPTVAPTARAAVTAPEAVSFGAVLSSNALSVIQLQGSDADGTALAFATTTTPAHGVLSNLNVGTGVVVYAAELGYTGADSFEFTITSGGETSAPATVSITVTGEKTRVIDTLTNPDGTPLAGTVTLVLTEAGTAPSGLIEANAAASALLNGSGQFDLSVFPSHSVSPVQFYQVWFADAVTHNTQMLGIYEIPASTSPITLTGHKVTNDNVAAQYVFASKAEVEALTRAVAAATTAQLYPSLISGDYLLWNGTTFANSRITENGNNVTVNGNLITTGTITGPLSIGLGGLSDVNLANVTNGDFLHFNNGQWSSGALTESVIPALDASKIGTGQLLNERTSATSNNNANTIVARDENGNFTAGTITVNNLAGQNLTVMGTINTITVGKGANNEVGNVAVGELALSAIHLNTGNTDSRFNTGIGTHALRDNQTGSDNTGVGAMALRDNISGYHNAALGHYALGFNLTGGQNTSVGTFSSYNNLSGSSNTVAGMQAFFSSISGSFNTASGRQAMFNAVDGNYNTATGYWSLVSLKSGSNNSAYGTYSGYDITSGANNTFIGYNVGGGIKTGSGNVVLGANVVGLNETLTNNIIIANGSGQIKAQHDGTSWNFPTRLNILQQGSENIGLSLQTRNATPGNYFGQFFGFSGNTYQKAGVLYEVQDGNLRGKLHFAVNGLPNSTNVTLSDARMTIDFNGNVGVGTANPVERLDVVGNVKLNGAGRGLIFPDGTKQTTAATTTLSAILNQTTQQPSANFNISGNGTVAGTLTAGTLTTGAINSSGTLSAAAFDGNGAALTNLNASNITSGTLANARLGVVPIANGGTGLATGPTAAGQFLRSSGSDTWSISTLGPADVPDLGASYIQNSTSQQPTSNFNISGDGTVGGTLSTATGIKTPAISTSADLNINLNTAKDGVRKLIINNGDLAPVLTVDETGVVSANGSGLTNLNASNLSSGTVAPERLSGTYDINVNGNAASATNFTGNLNGDVTGPQGTTVVASVGGKSAATVASATDSVNNAASVNTPNTIVKRDATGNFTAGTVTAALNGNATTATSAKGVVTAEQEADIVSPVAGQIYFNTTTKVFRQFDGETWKTIDADLATRLNSPGTLNDSSNPVDWTRLKNVPASVGATFSAGNGINISNANVISNTGVLSVNGSGVLSSSGGANPSISLSGVVPIANGGTGISTLPSTSGQFLRSSAAGTWAISALQSSDLPDLGENYIKNGTTQQASTNFNISGNGIVGGSFTLDQTAANDGTLANALVFGAPGSGEGIGSKRTASGNQFGLDLFTNSTRRLSIASSGLVSISDSLTVGSDITAGRNIIIPAGNGSYSGNGDGLTNLNAANISTGTLDNARLGVVPTANGGTGLSAPGTIGNVLRSNGSIWVSAPLTAADVAAGSSNYIQSNPASQQTGVSFNIAGNGTIGTDLNVNGNLNVGSSLFSIGSKVGIGTNTPQSTLQVNGYAQLALTAGAPPTVDCDDLTKYGRMKVDATNSKLYVCTSTGWKSASLVP